MVFIPQVSPLEPCAHLSPPPYAPHALSDLLSCGICVIFCFRRCVNDIFTLLDATHRRLAVNYRRFRAAYRPHLQASSSPRRILDFAQRRLIFTDVSGQHIGHTFKSQAVQEECILFGLFEDGTETSAYNCQSTLRNIT